ncbi:MAG: hypothetical protein GWN93_26910 [Deltaproteobacteria bacterium]|nr:hypothetical protein [Deltaproteobacteria bacterium]
MTEQELKAIENFYGCDPIAFSPEQVFEQVRVIRRFCKALREAKEKIKRLEEENKRLKEENERLNARINDLEIEIIGHDYTINLLTAMVKAGKKLEEVVDELNGKRGTAEELCLLCGTNFYDSTAGIIHGFNCPLAVFRRTYISPKDGILRDD